MSHKEQDKQAGEITDFIEEKNEFSKEFHIDDLILAISAIIDPIMKSLHDTGKQAEAQCLVCFESPENKQAAWWIARKHKLKFVTSPQFPEEEYCICREDQIETLIHSRAEKKREQQRSQPEETRLWIPGQGSKRKSPLDGMI